MHNEGLKIGKRYLVKEVELLLMVLHGKRLKMGELEQYLIESLNRNQIKYLTSKLVEDKVIYKDGRGSGTIYSIHPMFTSLRGESLTEKVIDYLRTRYNIENSPKTT